MKADNTRLPGEWVEVPYDGSRGPARELEDPGSEGWDRVYYDVGDVLLEAHVEGWDECEKTLLTLHTQEGVRHQTRCDVYEGGHEDNQAQCDEVALVVLLGMEACGATIPWKEAPNAD